MCTMSILAPDARTAAPSGSRPTRYEPPERSERDNLSAVRRLQGRAHRARMNLRARASRIANHRDITQRMAPEMSGTTPPYIPGLDASGIREDTGSEPQA